MNFSALKGLTIPEGVVTQIADASGRVLWSAVQKVVITLTGTSTTCYAEYKGTRYTYPSTFEAAVGDEISMYVGDGPSAALIFLNGQQVATGQSKVTYSYTVVSNATFAYSTTGSGMSVQLKVNITETPFTFTINGTEYSSYPSMTWIEWAVESDYNTGGFYYDPLTDLIKSSTNQIVKDSSGRSVHTGETITPGGSYNYKI